MVNVGKVDVILLLGHSCHGRKHILVLLVHQPIDLKLRRRQRLFHRLNLCERDAVLYQPLRIKAFFGTSENAVKTQIWIAISVYVLVAIVKKRLNLPRSLYENLQILSLTLCEQMPLDELLSQIDTDQNPSESHNQMNLFD